MIKDWLKRLDLPRRVNSRLKSRALVANYERTVTRYAAKCDVSIGPQQLKRIDALAAAARKPGFRIFFAGTDEEQDKSGFLQALQRVGDVRCFVRTDGGWGQNDPAAYQQRRYNNTRRLEELFASNAAEGWVPHLLITQTWACLVEPACFSRLRSRYDVFVANLAMDDRHQFWGARVAKGWDGTYSLIPHIDITLTAAPEAVAWYRKEGGAAVYFPEASDPEIFHPFPALPKIHDVCFVGGRYGIRERIVTALRDAGIRVTAYGNGWEGGRIPAAEVPRLFAQSKIVLGVGTIGHSDSFCALKLRDFDAPMSGSCYLTMDNPDLNDLFEIGREIVTYRDIAGCVATAKRLLANDDEREAIARAGRVRALSDHTWDGRFLRLFRDLDACARQGAPSENTAS